MEKTIGIVGGDLRIIRLCELFAKDKYKVFTYGLDKYDFTKENILKCASIQEVSNNCKMIVSGVPFSRNNKTIDTPFSNGEIEIENLFKVIQNKTLIAGGIFEYTNYNYNIEIIDLLKEEEFTVLNVIPTVEGAIKTAIEETEFTLNGANCLVLGFGRIAKLLSKSLKSMNAKVDCVARKESDLAWIKAYGYNAINLRELDSKLNCKYDIIFNTIPYVILDKNRLDLLKKYKPLIIELASKPWGVDFEYANKLGIRVINLPGLPGKIAPLASAINIKNIIEKRL